MPEKSMNQAFRLKKIDEIRNDLIGKMNQNEVIVRSIKKNFVKFWIILITHLL